MPADKDIFRKAWGKFATGVSVITSMDEHNQVQGMTANGIMSVSLEPMLNQVSIGFHANHLKLIQHTGRYGISILRDDQFDIAYYFSRKPEDRAKMAKPANLHLVQVGTSYKVQHALAYFDCKVVSSHLEGDHILFIGAVEHIETGDGIPLMFYEGKYPKLTIPAPT